MLIHDVLRSSTANGPGDRFVVWVQGCSRRCPGCFNPVAQPFPGTGYDITIPQIMSGIPDAVEGITISGGEPFEQPEELLRLVRAARDRKLSVLIYTGYTYEELMNSFSGMKRELMHDVLKHTDYLIDGPYVRENPSRNKWAGSGNQRFLLLSEGIVVADLTEKPDNWIIGELIINKKGTVTTTGILDGITLQL
ncbi:MAG: Pyruvate formate-lyase 1-activating enzyme [Spirochaetes bacterium ADurb.Bin215]|nr:MAG: Pyruvate formate-lyase 1-activating enzyme [Spirochaetes bacterium ADurb.Bin215]